MTPLTEIEQHLSRWMTRLRWQAALLWALRGLLAGLALSLGFSLLARLRPLYTVPTLVSLSLIFALAGLGLALVIAYFWPRSRLAVARYADRAMGLQERTSAALELARDNRTPAWLKEAQWADAARAARAANPRQGLPFRVQRTESLLCVGLAVALAFSLYLPNPQQAVLAHEQAVDKTIAEQIEKIEQAIEAIENNPELTDEQKDALIKPLEDAKEQLENGDLTQEQAVQVLTETEDALQAQANQDALDKADDLKDAGENLSQNPTTADVGEALQNGDIQGAADELRNIDVSQLTPEERAALADQLAQMADAVAGNNPELADALHEAADALRNGDVQAAEEALNRAADLMDEAANEAADAQAAADAAEAVGDAQDAVAEAGEGQQGNGQDGQNGNGQDGQNGNGQDGQNGNGQDGQNGNGQDGQNGNGNGQDGQNGNGNGNGGNGTNGSGGGWGTGHRDGSDDVYTPLGETGEEVTLDGNGDPNGEVIGEGEASDEEGSVTVPYDEVFSDYYDAVRDAIDSGDIPLDLRDLIRDYFGGLTPK